MPLNGIMAGCGKRTRAKPEPTGKRVAIVGSGPAGLTAAYYLSKLGHGSPYSKSCPVPGGMMRIGIPGYRVPRDALDEEIREIESMGVEIKTNSRVDSLDALFEQGYHVILVTIGAHEGRRLPIPGADQEGVLLSTDFLRDVNLGKEVNVGKRVVVIGGGNVAFDCARVARRLGAEEVHLVCLESRDKMVATPRRDFTRGGRRHWIHASRTFTRILAEEGHITGSGVPRSGVL